MEETRIETEEAIAQLGSLLGSLVRELNDTFLEMAAEGAGWTNVNVIRRKRDTLIAFMRQEIENVDDDSILSDFRQPQ